MRFLPKTHPLTKMALEILAINHCIPLTGVRQQKNLGVVFNNTWNNDEYTITFEKDAKQYNLVFDLHYYFRLDTLRNKPVMKPKQYKPNQIKEIAYDVLNHLI
jgi:hypothetical protein